MSPSIHVSPSTVCVSCVSEFGAVCLHVLVAMFVHVDIQRTSQATALGHLARLLGLQL